MFHKKSEKGQALIIIVFAIIGLIGITGLAVDGGRTYVDRQSAQTSSDSAALGSALANIKNAEQTTPLTGTALTDYLTAAAKTIATTNGFAPETVTVETQTTTEDSLTTAPFTNCNGTTSTYTDTKTTTSTYIQVKIVTNVDTSFAKLVGINQMSNCVESIARANPTDTFPLFDGNALVSLGSTGIDFSAIGTPDWAITGGGIFSNSVTCDSLIAGGSAIVAAPKITTVTTAACAVEGITGIPVTQNAPPYTWDNYKDTLPPIPECTQNAVDLGSGNWEPAAGTAGTKIGSKLNLATTAMHFAPGLYCIDSMPPNNVGSIYGTEVTFYSDVPNFQMKYAGSGAGMTASGPTSGIYKGVLMYIKPEVSGNTLLNTQALDLRGNGDLDDMNGSIIAPSATITMFGNSTATGYKAQFIGYKIETGGTADITVHYDDALTDEYTIQANMELTK